MKSLFRIVFLLLASTMFAVGIRTASLQAQPSLSISGATVTEGNAGTVQAVTTVTLSPASSDLVTVNFESSAATPPATGGAACGAGVDFITPNGNLQFNPGDVSKSISVSVCGDAVEELDEKFRVRLFGASGATIATSQGPVTIVDDDDVPALPTLSIDDLSVPEGNSGSTTQNATVRLSATTTQPVTLSVAALPGTATVGINCISGADVGFIPLPRTIASGQTSLAVSFNVCGNTVFEPDETFTLVLRNPANATLGDSVGQITITNDDLEPVTISIRDTTVTEGDLAPIDLTLTFTLSRAAAGPVTVEFIPQGGTATLGTGCGGAVDFASPQRGFVEFSPSQTSRQITAGNICGNLTAEPDETFSVTLGNPSGAVLGDGVGQVTIRNDDVAGPVVPRDDDDLVAVVEPLRAELRVDLACAACPTQAAPDIVFFVTAKNTGNASASNVLVRYVLPKDVAFVGVEQNQLGTCQQNGETADGALHVNCTLSSLPAGASRSVLIKGKTPATIADGTQLVSSAFIDPDNTIPEENDINNLELMFTTVRAVSDLQITGEMTKSNVRRLGPPLGACASCRATVADVQLRLIVRNNGPFRSRATTVRTEWLGGVRFAASGTGTVLGTEVFSVPALNSGATHTIQRNASARIQSHNATTGQARSTVDPDQTTFDSIVGNNVATVSVTLP